MKSVFLGTNGRQIVIGSTVTLFDNSSWTDINGDEYPLGLSLTVIDDLETTHRYINVENSTIEFAGVATNNLDFI
jgi:hypothetical protein